MAEMRKKLSRTRLQAARLVFKNAPLGLERAVASLDGALRITHIPRILYHYTSQQGFLGIVEHRAIWASSIFHLNDAAEFV
jgi:hypothetical protein